MLFPLVGHKTDQLIHHGIALPGAHPVLIVQRHQRQRSTAVSIRPLIQPGAELRFKIAAVEHAGQEIVIHIVPAELPLPRGHPILRQVAARQRSRHLQLPELAVRLDQAAQHAVHLPIAQDIIHLQAIVLPGVCGLLIGFRQGHVFKGGLCVFCKGAQILFRPFFFHAFFPTIRCRTLSPPAQLCHTAAESAAPITGIIPSCAGRFQQNAQTLT